MFQLLCVKYLNYKQDTTHFAGVKRQNFMRAVLHGIIAKQNDNKIFSVYHLLVCTESTDNTAIMNTLLLNDFKCLGNNFL